MPLSLNPLAANVTEVRLASGARVLFSYATPIAATLSDGTRIRTSAWYSVTTSRHLNRYGYKDAKKVPQEDLDQLAK